jgi:hypothetical protein
MMTLIVAGFVLVCAFTTLTLVFRVMRGIEVEEPHTADKPLPERLRNEPPIRRMDIPRKHPAIKTRHSRRSL